MDFCDLGTYNGYTGQNMWVDFNNYENAGTPDVFEEPDIDNFIDNLNDWN